MVSRKNWEKALSTTEVTSLDDVFPILLGAARLAPSMHNTQPWLFKIQKNELSIRRNIERNLAHGDAELHGYAIGLGAVIENIAQVCDYYGLSFKVDTQDIENMRITFSLLSSPKKQLDKKKQGNSHKKNEAHLVFGISRRLTNRSPYQDTPPKKDFVLQVNNIKETTAVIGKKKEKLAEIIQDAVMLSFADRNFRKELATWIRLGNPHDRLGMSTDSMNFPKFIHPLIRHVLPHLPVGKVAGKKDRHLVETSPLLFIISTSTDTRADWILAGRIYQRISLMSTQRDMSTHPMYAAIHRKEYRHIVKTEFTPGKYPQFIIRVGYPTKKRPHSARLPIDKLMHENV